MKKYFIKISLIIIAFTLSSCGGGSATSSGDSSKSKLNIQTKQSIFDQNKNILNIDFIIKNDYHRDIEVSLKNLSVDVEPCNVRNVSMTPKSIYFSDKLKDQYVTALVEFAGECNPTSYKISSSNILTLNKKSNTIDYKSEKMEINPSIFIPEDNNITNYKFFNI
ncbi:MAG TPA: hypothetical protein EYP02_04430, partial [Sulfurovum sp.]|nr:hypothetical protein [Sulfurovum sp.]